MAKAKYQIEDFLTNVKDDYKAFIMIIHEKLLQEGYKSKIQLTKNNDFQLSYFQAKIKSVEGRILIFLFHNDELMVRIYAKNNAEYPEVLNSLPEIIVNQIDKADICKKMIDPDKCWKGCMGYEFYIRGNHYQKCYTNCFQLDVDSESIPYLLKLIESESEARLII